MPALLNLEAIGPRGEELALAAGDAIDVPVGFDPDLECATFDADSLEPDDLKGLLAPYPAAGMTSWQVSARVGNVKNNGASLIEPPAA